MKTCSKCELTKSLSDFPVNKSKKDGRGSYCKMCQREYVRKHYNENTQYYVDKSLRRKQQAKQFIAEYKDNDCCVHCGESATCCLEFHHRDPTKKDFVLSLAGNNGFALSTIQREIEKCDLVCANCHRKIHADILGR